MHGCHINAVLIGSSLGGVPLLQHIFAALPKTYPIPVLVVQHVHPEQGESPAHVINADVAIRVKDAEDKEPIEPGTAYFAPPGYHLLVERDQRIALSVDEKVNWSRPSVDVLFQSAVYLWAPHLLGIVLSGANSDGAAGIVTLKQHGCMTLAQEPSEAKRAEMPASAIATGCVDEVLGIAKIASMMSHLGGK